MEWDAVASFGEVLKELRNRKKVSRRELAQRLRMHPKSIENWERGAVLPDRARVKDLMGELELSEGERLLLLEAHAGYRFLPRLHNVPAAHNPYFTGREEVLTQLHDRLAEGRQIALTQAISGLGGIGKTQVALEYVHRFQKAYFRILWVSADSRDALFAGFVRLAQDLELPEKDLRDQDKIVQAVRRRLGEYVNWLLVLDNVEDLSLLSSFIPANHLGSVLLTTRRLVTEPVAQAITLDVLSDDDGVLLLLKRAKRLAHDEPLKDAPASEVVAAKAITWQLGGLPLALDQAGAYILENQCSLSYYLELFKQERHVLLQRRGTVPTDHPASVTVTFSLAFEQISQKNQAASELLKLCAFLAPDAIPLDDLVMQSAVHLGTHLESVATHALQLNQALEVLQAYSLVRCDRDNRTIFVHRLVQAVLQGTMEGEEEKKWKQRVVRAVNASFPNAHDVEQWRACERWLPHAQVCADWIEHEPIMELEIADLLNRVGLYLDARAQYSQAEPLFKRVLLIYEQHLGIDHLRTAQSYNHLAVLYQNQGKYAEAEPLYRHALTIREQQLGNNHHHTALSLNNLAALYYQQGKYTEAEPLYRRALTIREQQTEADYSETALSLNNLAALYKTQGKDAEAEPLYRQALAICGQQLGTDHPYMALSLNNLAALYYQQGKHTEAEPLCKQALTICEQQLGDHHPYTALSLNNLAELYRMQKKYTKAEPLYQHALSTCERQLGTDHSCTANSLNNLAGFYDSQGKYAEAEPLYRRALAIREQLFGSDHLDTDQSLNNLAMLYLNQGKYAEAEPLMIHVLSIFKKRYGTDHLYTALGLNNLAGLYYCQGRYTEAEPLMVHTLAICEQLLGIDHPYTTLTLNTLVLPLTNPPPVLLY